MQKKDRDATIVDMELAGWELIGLLWANGRYQLTFECRP